jgi:hypothetical protein
MVNIYFKGVNYEARALMAIAAHIVDLIITDTDYSAPEKIIRISYKRDNGQPQHYIGIFTLDFSRINLDSYLSMVRDDGMREEIRRAFGKILVRIKTNPFYMPNENLELVDNIGLINMIGEAEDAAVALAKLREPDQKIMGHLARQLEAKLGKEKFLQTQFVKSSEILIRKLLGIYPPEDEISA